tara:strand:- start:500 stop:1258 length:759 start_codon:yes stop_codon:yes gene_type:complete
MQQVGKHCWCSPKSGIILAESTWQNVLVPDSDYKFLQMRDPYNRVVSMFLNKIVDIDVRHLADVKRERWVPWIDVPDPYDDINSRAEVYKNYLTHIGPGCYRLPLDPNKNLLDYTFRDFVFDVLANLDLYQWFDPHFAYQTRFFFSSNNEIRFDDVVLLEDLPEAYAIPARELGVEVNLDPEHLKKAGRVGEKEDIDGAFHQWTVKQWWDLGRSPLAKYYDSFYTDDIRAKVKELYAPDFDLIAQVKNEHLQ